MSWNEIKSAVLQPCGSLLEPHGYKFIKSRNSHVKASATGKLIVHIGLTATDHGNYYANIGCGVRNNTIENIVNMTATCDKSAKPHTATVFISSHNRWLLNTAEDQAVTIAGFQAYIKEVALPFLQQEYSFQNFSTMLNTTAPDKFCPFNNSIRRYHRGLAAAKLAGDTRYEELKKQYSIFLRALSNGFYFPEFEKCVKNIEEFAGGKNEMALMKI